MARTYKVRTQVDVDWDRTPEVEGTVVELASLPEILDNRRYLVVDTGPELLRVYESKDLESLFAVVMARDMVRIRYVESVPLKGGRTFHRFRRLQMLKVGDPLTFPDLLGQQDDAVARRTVTDEIMASLERLVRDLQAVHPDGASVPPFKVRKEKPA
jgi:hypothetical protein